MEPELRASHAFLIKPALRPTAMPSLLQRFRGRLKHRE
jgi:hypothetical protein